MVDVSCKAGEAVELLDGLKDRLDAFLSGYDELEAAGGLTPEIEARVAALLQDTSAYLTVVREAVDPTLAPVLLLKRRTKAKVRKMSANGDSEHLIRSEFDGVVGRMEALLPEAERAQCRPLMIAALEEVFLETATA